MANNNSNNSSNRGFASMDEGEQRESASKGGKASGGNLRTIRKKPAVPAKKVAPGSHIMD